ncbi:MAG: hypothetical protein AAFZ15_11050 [Bacteroidota bacterium]
MQRILFLFFSICFLCSSSTYLTAQQTEDNILYVIETVDGNRYIGSILSQDEETVQLRTKTLGDITIQRDQIGSMELLDAAQIVGGNYLWDTPFVTRYYVGSSAYSLRKGEGYYQNSWIFYNNINVGLTDNIDVGIGIVPLFLFTFGSGDGITPIWLTTKIALPVEKDKFNLAAGGVYANVLGGDTNGGGQIYGVSTFGSRNRNVSLGIGWFYGADEGLAERPTFSFSTMQRGKPKWAFVSENYFFGVGDEGLVILSAGARYLGDKISLDMSGFTFVYTGGGQDVFPILPWLSVSVPFGGRN